MSQNVIRFERQESSLAWVTYDPRPQEGAQQRRSVRSQAAQRSANQRKATLAKKKTLRNQQYQRLFATNNGQEVDEQQTEAQSVISSLFARLRSRDATATACMAQKADRTLLWTAFTSGNTCFEAALFVAGTFANTCGIHASKLHTGFGSGLLFLRGMSLNRIQEAIIYSPRDSLNSVSIALLAGWERRFGDQGSYQVHLHAWKMLPLATGSLDDSSIAALADVALECFREASQERALIESESRTSHPAGLPPGFQVMPTGRPESMSLLGLVAKITNTDPAAPASVTPLRRYGLETLAWSASHSIGVEPSESYEDGWDQHELTALYHIRSAQISLNGIIIRACLEAHNLPWGFDMQAGLDIHAEACQHLRSQELMGTRYQEIALWSKFVMIAVASPSPSNNAILSTLLKQTEIRSWCEMQSLLVRHEYPEALLGHKCRRLFKELVY
jgi:hypothetical protein